MKVVLDTNVMIAANGRNTHADEGCRERCIDLLLHLKNLLASSESIGPLVIDDEGLIYDEYADHLSHSGQPGVGDQLFMEMHNYWSKLHCVAITQIDDETRGFAELPPNPIDKSDRKFLAAAVVAEAEVVNALDTDWHEQAAFLDDLGVTVRQLCPDQGC